MAADSVHGGSAKAGWKQLPQHAAASPESPLDLAHQLVLQGPSRAGRRVVLTAEVSEQALPRDSSNVADGISI